MLREPFFYVEIEFMATKTLQIKKKKRAVLTPKSLNVVHDESGEILVPDDAFISQSVEDAVEAVQQGGKRPVLPQGLQTSHFFDAYLAESQNLKQAVPQSQTSEVPAPEPPPSSPAREVPGAPCFKFFCYRCGQKLRVPAAWAGKMHTCKACHSDIIIPEPLAESP